MNLESPAPLSGWLLKKSPSVARQLFGGGKQKRFVTLSNARLVYSKEERALDASEEGCSGVVDLISNDCEVSEMDTTLILRPKSGSWLKGTFTGADGAREFEFDCAGSDIPQEKWFAALKQHTEYAMNFKLALLQNVPLMKRLPKDQHNKMASACIAATYEPGDVIIRQGELGDEFFVIAKGEANVQISGKKVTTLKPGDYFGENALRQAEPRAATVTAATSLTTFFMKRRTFEELGLNLKLQFPNRRAVGVGGAKPKEAAVATEKSPEEVELISSALKKNLFLQTLVKLDDDKIKQLAAVARKQDVPEGTTLITEGDLNGDTFYIVHEGCFEVTISSKSRLTKATSQKLEEMTEKPGDGGNLKYGPGSSFGELALMYLEPRKATVKSVEKSAVWVIDRHAFKDILMKLSDEKVGEYVQVLKEVNNLHCLLEEERVELAKNLVEVQFSKDDLIVEQGQSGSTFYILYKGEVAVVKDDKEVRKLKADGKGGDAQYFGEAALLDNEVRGATVKVISDEASTLALDRETFNDLLGPLKDILEANRKEAGSRKMKTKKNAGAALGGAFDRGSRPKILMSDLKKIGLLGCGGFGIVELMEHPGTGETYALKALSKGYVVKAGMQQNTMNEKDIQISLDSDFVVKLFETYNSDQQLFFLLEPALGGELYATYMRRGLHGSVKHAQFYVAGTVYAFDHLHEKGIIYRDLKPENLLLTEHGHVKLTDMGLAKFVTGKTYTSCGTPDYFAPEVIRATGHNKAVDWWELGILTFELMTGHPPFEADDPTEIYRRVCAGIEKITFPLDCRGPVGDFVTQLCKKQPSERLPMRAGGVKNIITHQWYVHSKFNWEAMQDLSMEPPYKPVVKSKKDLANFSANAGDAPRQIPYKDDGSGWDKTFATA